MEHKIFALLGPHASGKTSLATGLMELGVNIIPNYTTDTLRPQKAPQLWKCSSKQELSASEFIVRAAYKGELYGLKKSDILGALDTHAVSLVILPIAGLEPLKRLIKDNLITTFLLSDYATLVEHMLGMGYGSEEIQYHLQYAENNHEYDAWKLTDHVIKAKDKECALRQQLALMGLSELLPEPQLTALLK